MASSRTEPPRSIVCVSIDVDWAAPEVLAPMIAALDERGLRATIFCTHAGIEVPGHERALHPNFRRSGDTMRALCQGLAPDACLPDDHFYPAVIERTLAFCPEAVGTRSHSLYYDSLLLPVLARFNIRYDSTYLLPLVQGLRPVWKEYGILEMPIYFNDHFELKSGATGFQVTKLRLDEPGLKILQFHPNMAFINAASHEHYLECKPCYHDAGALAQLRRPGCGAGTFFIDVLDAIAERKAACMTIAEVDDLWRGLEPGPGCAAEAGHV